MYFFHFLAREDRYCHDLASDEDIDDEDSENLNFSTCSPRFSRILSTGDLKDLKEVASKEASSNDEKSDTSDTNSSPVTDSPNTESVVTELQFGDKDNDENDDDAGEGIVLKRTRSSDNQ